VVVDAGVDGYHAGDGVGDVACGVGRDDGLNGGFEGGGGGEGKSGEGGCCGGVLQRWLGWFGWGGF